MLFRDLTRIECPLILSWRQAAEKAKKAPKVKAPDINDEEFPGLPGMAKPKVQEAEEDSDGEKASGAGEEGEDGGEEEKAVEGDKVGSCFADAQEGVLRFVTALRQQ